MSHLLLLLLDSGTWWSVNLSSFYAQLVLLLWLSTRTWRVLRNLHLLESLISELLIAKLLKKCSCCLLCLAWNVVLSDLRVVMMLVALKLLLICGCLIFWKGSPLLVHISYYSSYLDEVFLATHRVLFFLLYYLYCWEYEYGRYI